MDLGIAGRRALVCAASKGLGRGCAEALAREGVDVTILAAKPRVAEHRDAMRANIAALNAKLVFLSHDDRLPAETPAIGIIELLATMADGTP